MQTTAELIQSLFWVVMVFFAIPGLMIVWRSWK